MNDTVKKIRVDKWLWAARFFKTRGNAAEAVAGGKTHVNGARVKPAKMIGIGDELRIRRGNFEFTLMVRAISRHRRPAGEAQRLYEEHEFSIRRRLETATQLREQRLFGARRQRRPDKKGRRELLRIKKGDKR